MGRFLDSYRRHDPGTDHRLVLLFNGFSSEEELAPWRGLLDGIEHEELLLRNPMLDLVAYREAARLAPAERYCFLNSYSVILGDRWLGKLRRALDTPGTGLVGATGSWASIRSYQRFMLGFGGRYAKVFDDRKATAATLAAVAARHASSGSTARRAPLRFARALLEQSHGFTSFPSPHIRTNGFMVAAEVFGQIALPTLSRKADAYRFESGRRSLTAQSEALGLSSLVVGRDGRAYASEEWAASGTLWQGDQENLLIADNRTMDYELGDSTARTALSRFAWGEKADPRTTASRGQAVGERL